MTGSVGLREVAARAGVSVSTVSNAINRPGRVAEETAKRVQSAIDELGFVRNDAARQLRVGQSRTIGVIVIDIRNPFFADVARGAELTAETFGNSVLIGNSDQSPAREKHYLELFEEQRVLGVLVSPRGDVMTRLARLRDRGIPSVLLDRIAESDAHCSVSVDDVAGGALATRHLIERGKRKVCFVGGPVEVQQYTDRLKGVRESIATAPDVALEIINVEQPTVAAGRAVGDEIASRSPEGRPDGIFASNDLVALGILQSLVGARGIRIPRDIAVVGYDDIDFAAASPVPLTSIRQPTEGIGRASVELLMDEVSNPRHAHRQVVFQPELIVRASS